MAYTVAAKNRMLAHVVGQAAVGAAITAVSLHTADPGTTGASEVSASGNDYARITVTGTDFDAPSADVDGEIHLNNDLEFDGPASGSVTHFGLWAGATFMAGGPITGDNAFNAAGVFLLKAGTKLDLNA